MDWTGENVSGMIVMKVRDELLLESQGCPPDENTLGQIATDQNESENMDLDPTPLESTVIHRDDTSHRDISASGPASSQTPSYTDMVKSPGKGNNDYQHFSQRGRVSEYRKKGYHGGEGDNLRREFFIRRAPSVDGDLEEEEDNEV